MTGSNLEELLGPKMVKPDFLNRTNAIGIANGLAWTSIGGETLPIEVQVMDNGSGKIDRHWFARRRDEGERAAGRDLRPRPRQ